MQKWITLNQSLDLDGHLVRFCLRSFKDVPYGSRRLTAERSFSPMNRPSFRHYPWGSLGELKRMQRNARGTSASFVSDQIVQDGPRCREVPPYHSVSRLFHGVDHQLAARI